MIRPKGDVLAVHGLAGGLAVETPGEGVEGDGGHDALLGSGEERVLDVEAALGDGAEVDNDSGGAGTGNTVRVEHVGDVEVLRTSSPTGLTSVLPSSIYSITRME